MLAVLPDMLTSRHPQTLLSLLSFLFMLSSCAYAQSSLADTRVVISGAVPDETTKAALLGKIREVYGADQVVDQLAVGGVTAPPNWGTYIAKMISPQIKSISKGQLAVEGTNVSIRGEVANDAVRKTIANNFANALNSTYVVKNGLRIGAASQSILDQALANRIVEFENGSALLTNSGKLILDEMVEAIKKANPKRLAIVGHTDNIGSPTRNLALSRSRADSVKTYLIAKGVPADLITTSGLGADQPIASNSEEAGRKRNRRIEFRVSQ